MQCYIGWVNASIYNYLFTILLLLIMKQRTGHEVVLLIVLFTLVLHVCGLT